MATPSSSKDRIDQAHHHIHRALCPRIAVVQTSDVADVLRPNGFEDLAHCLRPFEDSVRGVTVRTSQLESKQCTTFPVQFEPLAAFSPPTSRSDDDSNGGSSRTLERPEELLDSISAHTLTSQRARSWHTTSPPLDPLDASQLSQLQHAPIEDVTPWFSDARDLVLASRPVSRHETFGHPAGVILAVSTNSADPMNAFASLYAATQQEACDAFAGRPYVDPNVLRYYVLVHDSAKGGDIEESKTLLESIKKLYGLNCCILVVNSASQPSSSTSELWTSALSPQHRKQDEEAPTYGSLFDDEDVKRLRAFVRELVAQSLIPWMERSVGIWNESIAASRKGITGRLFGAGRKFFGGGSSTQQSAASSSRSSPIDRPSWDASGAFYYHTALEAQTRRLADFAFMTRDYKLAAATYDVGRKDYANDKAHRYAAGATEMFGLSHLMMMMGSKATPIDVDSYLAAASALYRSAAAAGSSSPTASASDGFSLLLEPLRSVLLYYEAYRALDFYRPAPAALLRVTASSAGGSGAGADLEVMGAMLVEQAALASLRVDASRPALRKWAFYLVMAGHRYAQCGAKMLCQRAFGQARGVYLGLRRPARKEFRDNDGDDEDGKGGAYEEQENEQVAPFDWSLIRAHIEHELGTQALNDGRADDAVEHLLETLRPPPGTSQQEGTPDAFATLQAGYLTQFLAAYESAVGAGEGGEAELELPHPLVDVTKAHIQRIGSDASGSSDGPEWQALETRLASVTSQGGKTAASLPPLNHLAVSQDNAFSLELHLENPLCTPLSISNIHVAFADASGGSSIDAVVAVDGEDPSSRDLELQPREQRTITLTHRCSVIGRYRVTSISYRLAGRVPIVQPLTKRGPRLNATVEQRRSRNGIYGEDESLVVVVRPPHPALEVALDGCAQDESIELGMGEEREVQLRLTNVGKAPMRDLKLLTDRPEAAHVFAAAASPPQENGSGEMAISNALAPSAPVTLLGPDMQLAPGESTQRRILLRGAALGQIRVRLLFVFQQANDGASEAEPSSTHYAGKARHEISLHVQPVVDIGVEISPARQGFAYSLAISALNLARTPGTQPVEVTEVSFLSPRWRCDAAARGEEEENSTTPPVHEALSSLPPGQVVTGYASIIESDHLQGSAVGMDHTVRQLRAQVAARDINHTARPGEVRLQVSSSTGSASSQESDEQAQTAKASLLRSARTAWREAGLAMEFPTIPSVQDRRRIFPLYQPEDLDVIVEWQQQASDTTAAGHRSGRVFIFGLSLGPGSDCVRQVFSTSSATATATLEAGAPDSKKPSSGGQEHGRSMYEETDKQRAALVKNLQESSLANEEDPLVVDIDVQDGQESQSSPAASSRFVPVTFRVRNMSTTRSARCVIDLDGSVESDVDIGGAASSSSHQQGAAAPAPTIRKAAWAGRLTLRSSDAVEDATGEGAAAAGAVTGLIKPRQTILLRALAMRGAATVDGGTGSIDWELGDWSIKIDVHQSGAEDGAAIAHFNSGRLRSGRLLPRANAVEA